MMKHSISQSSPRPTTHLASADLGGVAGGCFGGVFVFNFAAPVAAAPAAPAGPAAPAKAAPDAPAAPAKQDAPAPAKQDAAAADPAAAAAPAPAPAPIINFYMIPFAASPFLFR
jgi:hypothetical protein